MGIAYGHGNGSFQQPLIFSTDEDSSGKAVAIGDLNNDTYPDLVIVPWGRQEMVVHFGRQNGVFSIEADHRIDIRMRLSDAALADFNSDGILDLAYGNERGDFSILLGVGDGSFHLEQSYATPSETLVQKTIPCDLNGDGMVDLVFSHVGEPSLVVMLNEGNRQFRSIAFPHEDEIYFNQIMIGHFDRDHHLDMAALINYGREIQIYHGFGNGSFATSENSIVFEEFGWGHWESGDFNGDHRLDLVTVKKGNVTIFLNDC